MSEKPATLKVTMGGKKIGEIPNTGNARHDAAACLQLMKDKGVYKPTTTFQAMFRQALSFCTTASYLYERDLRRMPGNFYSAAPFVVNAALGIELYFKTLSAVHGKELRGHQLVKLFDQLPPVAVDEIMAQCPAAAKGWRLDPSISFKGCLTSINDAFVTWRYLYEHEATDTIHFHEVIFVLDVLHEACKVHNFE